MDWRVRTAWWLLLAVMLVSALTPVEAGHRSGSRKGRRRNSGDHSNGSHKNKNQRSYNTQTHKPYTHKCSQKPKTTPKTTSSSQQYKTTATSWKAVTGKYKQLPNLTVATPITTKPGKHNSTKDQVPKNNATKPYNFTRPRYSQKPKTTPKTTSSSQQYKTTATTWKAVTEKYKQLPNLTVATPITTKPGKHNSTKYQVPKNNATKPYNFTRPGYSQKPKTTPKTTSSSQQYKTTATTWKAVTGKYKQLPNLTVATPITTKPGKHNSTKDQVPKNNATKPYNLPSPRYSQKPKTTPKTTSSSQQYKTTATTWKAVTGKYKQLPDLTVATPITTKPGKHNSTKYQVRKNNATKPYNLPSPRYSQKPKTTPKTTSSSQQYKTTATTFKAVTGKYKQIPNLTVATPITTKPGKHNSTKDQVPKNNATKPYNFTRPGYSQKPKTTPKTTSSSQQYKTTATTWKAVTEKYKQLPNLTVATPITTKPGKHNSTKDQVPKNNATKPYNFTRPGTTVQDVPGKNHPHSTVQPPGSRGNVTQTNTKKHPSGPVRNVTGKKTNSLPPGPVRNTTRTNTNNQSLDPVRNVTQTNPTEKPQGPDSLAPGPIRNQEGWQTQPPGPGGKVPHGGAKQPSAYDINPSHRPPPEGNSGSGSGSRPINLSSPFGYWKNFSTPSSPMIIIFPTPPYHHPSSISPRKPKGCDCYVEGRTAVCRYKLKDGHIPSCVNSTVSAVFIESKEIEQLLIDAFKHVPLLEYINITGTMLRSLPRDLFRDTRELKLLLVQKNLKLRSLDRDVFRDGSRLEDVILDHNNISSLERDVFTHLTNVKRLNLAYNKIRILPEGIFRDNRELQELRLSGNPVHINECVARSLLRNNVKLRVLLMRKCNLQNLPTGLPGNASNLEWLDLSHNKISKFPAEFIQNCTKLAYLGLAYNELKVLGSDLVFLHGGSLATLTLEGNPWHCDCDILPLASWASLRKDAVPEWPNCSSPHGVKKEPLQRWFHSKNATKCGDATSLLRADLNRVLSVARAIAERGPNFSTDLLPVSDKEVSFTATNYFLYATAGMTDADIDGVVWHWARFLEKVLNRRHLHYTEKSLNRTRIEPLTTTTTKPPAARAVKQRLRLKGFQPLMNFTYIMKNVPENLTKVVDDGIEEELKILFGVTNGTNTTSPNATAASVAALNSTGVVTAVTPNTVVVTTNVTLAPFSRNSTTVTTTLATPAPAIISTSLPPTPVTLLLNLPSVSANTPLSASASSVVPVNAILNITSPTNCTSVTNQNVTNSTSSIPALSATTASANGATVPSKMPNATKQMVAGLRSELREVLSILLLSIDRAKWDAAEQDFIKGEELRALQSPEHKNKSITPDQLNTPKQSTIPKNSSHVQSSAKSCKLIQPQLTVLVSILTLLAPSLV